MKKKSLEDERFNAVLEQAFTEAVIGKFLQKNESLRKKYISKTKKVPKSKDFGTISRPWAELNRWRFA